MIHLQDIRYVRLGTPDLEGAIHFATKIVGLQLVAREGKSAYFRSDKVEVRGDTRDHTLVYFEGAPDDHTIGFDLKEPADFDAVGAALDDHDFGARLATSEECELRRAKSVIAARDPTGNKIEIVARALSFRRALFPEPRRRHHPFQPYRPQLERSRPRREILDHGLQRAGFGLARRRAALAHRHGAPFDRASFPIPAPGVQHINHQVEDVDDVMKAYYFLKEQGVRIAWGPGRHPLSTAVMLYFYGPHGMVYEYSVGVKHILPEEEASYRPRQFPPSLTSFCMWGSVPDFPSMQAAISAGKPKLKAV